MSRKIAVVLFNLGGPDSKEAIRPFLYNFFMDPAIIAAPLPIRWLLAKYISITRSRGAAGTSYAALGGRSPLLENTEKQARALEKTLNEGAGGDKYKTFIAMRYWRPFIADVALDVKNHNPAHVVLLPLYPQFSTTTTGSSFKEWGRAADCAGIKAPQSEICCYPMDAGFVNAAAALIKPAYERALRFAADNKTPPPRVLFSAHGLPESIIKQGDPYQWQCEQTAAAIAEAIRLPALDWQICYQSRVGPKKWIGPSTEEALALAGAEGVPVVVFPHAFVSEHVETLVEIEIEYRHFAEKEGVPYFERVPTVSEGAVFIDGLADIVRSVSSASGRFSCRSGRVCPDSFGGCYLCAGSAAPAQVRKREAA